MPKKIAINGMGRIGRTTLRVWAEYFSQELDLAVVNTSGSMEFEAWVHLFKYDSNYGPLKHEFTTQKYRSVAEVTPDETAIGKITLKDREILVCAQKDPSLLPWSELEVDTVIEATGKFLTQEKANLHLQAGAKRVILSAPGKSPQIKTMVMGVNRADDQIISNASCTTNCVAPVTKIINRQFGIVKATMSTIHAYTDDQNLQDNSHSDLRRARTAGRSIIPTSTGAAKSVAATIPQLKGLFDGLSFRVPVSVGSVSDMVFVTSRKTSVLEVNQALIVASKLPEWKNILAVTDEPLVSQDIVGRRESSIVDLSLTQVVDGDLVKIVSWYDNEWGYSNRLLETAISLA